MVLKKERGESLPEAKVVGIWIRVSTEDQVRGESPEHHERRARHYAEAKGWDVREVYQLDAVSGKSVMGTTEAKRMLEHIQTGHITGLIFSKLARLARNTRELLDFADIFRLHDADLISLHEAIDTSTPAGRLFYTMIAAMAQWEREEIAERVAASVPIRAKLGKPLGGTAPFGYQWENRELVPDPKEAPVRKLLYEYFQKHRRKKTVARLLNDEGYRTRNGSKFTDTTVERLLRDPTAMGLRRANYTKSLGEKKHWELKPEAEWVHTPVPAIVTPELWQECNAFLDGNKTHRKPARVPVQLFAGLAYCVCGGKMSVPSNSPKYICQKCRNKIPTTDLEGVFQEQLRTFVLSPEEIAEHLLAADEALKEKQERLHTLEQELRIVERDMQKSYRAYLADEIGMQTYGRQQRPLEERRTQLEAEIPRLQADVDFAKIQILSQEEIVNDARDLYTRWPELAFEDRRQIVETIVEKIIVGNDDITIDLSYLPPAGKLMLSSQRNVTDSSRRSTSPWPERSRSGCCARW